MLTRYLESPAGAAGDHSVIYLPRNWRPNGTRKGLILAAGSGTPWTGALQAGVLYDIAKAATAAGYAVATSELGLDQYGNANCRTRIGALRTLLQSATIGAQAGRVHLAGFSQGAGNVLAWAGANPTLVSSITGWAPLVNLTALHATGGAAATAVNAAYSGAYSEGTHGAASNPQTMAAAGKYAGIPMTLCYSSTDGVIPPATVTTFASTVGSTAQTVNLGDVAHDWPLPNRTDSIAALLARMSTGLA